MSDDAVSPGGAFVPPTIEALQAMLPQYEVLAIIGVGGMGAVYKARQKNLDRMVAIKVLPQDVGAEHSFAERFQREAQAMAKLHHQRIVSVHDFGQAQPPADDASAPGAPLLYIIMEFVEGTDLYHLIKNGALDQNQVLAIITQICDALQYAHDKGIVHRDIKPANIMLDVEGNVKVADFGLAKLVDTKVQRQLTMTHMAMGTPDYIAPEQLETGAEVDHRADIYSLGVLIYEMLTGTVPRGAFLPPSQKATDPLDPRLDAVVTTAMQADPATRYQQITELWTDVDRIRTTPVPAATISTARVPVMSGGTGKVQLVTGQTGAAPRPETLAPTPAPAAPGNSRKIFLITLGSLAAIALLSLLGYVVFQPAPVTENKIAAADPPVNREDSRPREERSAPKPDAAPPPASPQTPEPKPAPEPVAAPTPEPAKPDPEPKPEPAPNSEPEPDPEPEPEPEPAAILESIDLFTKIDTAPHAGWNLDNGILYSPETVNGTSLVVPFDLPDEYILEAVIEPREKGPQLCRFSFPVAGRRTTAEIGGHNEKFNFRPMEGNGNLPRRLDGRHHLVFEMRRGEIRGSLDGEPFLEWSGDPSIIGPDDTRYNGMTSYNRVPLQHRLGLWFYHPHTIHQLSLHPPDWTPPAPLPADPPDATLTGDAPEPQNEAERKIAEAMDFFGKRFAEGPGAVFDAAVAKLNTSYAGALDREIARISASGKLDAVLPYKTEIESIEESAGAPVISPLPADTPAALRDMRQTYTDTIEKHAQKRDTDSLPLLRDFDKTLETLIVNFTRAQEIENALRIREAREQLKEKGTALLTGDAALKTAGNWARIFNGRDYTGWNKGTPRPFSHIDADEGILVFQGPERGDFYYTGENSDASFTDFEFKAAVKTVDQSNSGVFLHILPNGGNKQSAYEIQIANQNQDPQKTGSVWGVQPVDRMPARDSQWFELHIRVENETITVAVDGKTVNQFTDPGNADKRLGEGSIMLQWNGGPTPDSAVHFKDIMVRPLD